VERRVTENRKFYWGIMHALSKVRQCFSKRSQGNFIPKLVSNNRDIGIRNVSLFGGAKSTMDRSIADRPEQHADASDSAKTPVPLAPKPMRASITGVVWNCQADQSKCIAAFSRAEYERTHWIGIPIVLDDFKTEVGKVTAAWLSEDERIWITAIVEVQDEFRGFGLHFMGPQKHPEVLDPTTVSVVSIALCEPIDPEYWVCKVSPEWDSKDHLQ